MRIVQLVLCVVFVSSEGLACLALNAIAGLSAERRVNELARLYAESLVAIDQAAKLTPSEIRSLETDPFALSPSEAGRSEGVAVLRSIGDAWRALPAEPRAMALGLVKNALTEWSRKTQVDTHPSREAAQPRFGGSTPVAVLDVANYRSGATPPDDLAVSADGSHVLTTWGKYSLDPSRYASQGGFFTSQYPYVSYSVHPKAKWAATWKKDVNRPSWLWIGDGEPDSAPPIDFDRIGFPEWVWGTSKIHFSPNDSTFALNHGEQLSLYDRGERLRTLGTGMPLGFSGDSAALWWVKTTKGTKTGEADTHETFLHDVASGNDTRLDIDLTRHAQVIPKGGTGNVYVNRYEFRSRGPNHWPRFIEEREGSTTKVVSQVMHDEPDSPTNDFVFLGVSPWYLRKKIGQAGFELELRSAATGEIVAEGRLANHFVGLVPSADGSKVLIVSNVRDESVPVTRHRYHFQVFDVAEWRKHGIFRSFR